LLRRFFPGTGLEDDLGDCPALHHPSWNGRTGFDWKETELLIDRTLPSMVDQLTGRTLKAGLDTLPLKTLEGFPFAVFHNLGT
jgi:hypothetical protein